MVAAAVVSGIAVFVNGLAVKRFDDPTVDTTGLAPVTANSWGYLLLAATAAAVIVRGGHTAGRWSAA